MVAEDPRRTEGDREFFQGREIDGKPSMARIYTERGSEGITMGVTNALYNYGFENPTAP